MNSILRISLLLGICLCHASCSEEPKSAPKKSKAESPNSKPTDSQAFMGGYIMDETSYGDAADPAEVQEDNNSLPPSASLESDCPPVVNQQYRTCLAWSLSEARSILYKKATGKTVSFSAGFLYALNKEKKDVECQAGLKFQPILEKFQQIGIVPQMEFCAICQRSVVYRCRRSGANHRRCGIRRQY